ncbi:hypothetical protein ACWDOP_28070 [Nocardia sp. NPDC003693]
MTGDERDRSDPDRTDVQADWWQGPPAPGSRWESPHTVPPARDAAPPPPPPPPAPSPGPARRAEPTTQQPFVPPPDTGPPRRPYATGRPDPVRTGPNSAVGAPPPRYPTGPGVPIGPGPYATGPNSYSQFRNPQPPYGSGGPPSNARVWIYAGVGALVVALVAVISFVVVTRESGGQGLGTTTAAPTTTSRTTTTTSAVPDPVIAGYQVVVPNDLRTAWDVPADWTVDTSHSSMNSATDSVPVAGLAYEGSGYCTDNVRTQMFLTQTKIADTAAAAADIATRMARIGWTTNTSIVPGAAEPFDSADHSLHGVYLETTGTFTAADATCAKTFAVHTFAVSGGDEGALVLAIGADTGVDRAVTRDFARRLLATLRLF